MRYCKDPAATTAVTVMVHCILLVDTKEPVEYKPFQYNITAVTTTL